MSNAPMELAQPEAAGDGSRRRSLGLLLERFRAVVRRRGGKKALQQEATPVRTLSQGRQDGVRRTAVTEAPIAQPSQFIDPPTSPSVLAFGTPLDIDDADNSSILIADEPLQSPYAIADSSASLDEKARLLFAQYGLTYNPITRAAQEPPRKMRRVEKPIRIRLRWSCHECEAAVGPDRVCVACGHRRCKNCVKAPPSKVSQIMERTRKALESEREESEVLIDSSRRTMAPLEVKALPIVVEALPSPSENQAMLVYTLQPNGRGGVDMLHKIRAAPVVERVYKKPRQRVRWTCNRCHSLFKDREICLKCGHVRCEDCIRTPHKKSHSAPDATTMTSLQAKLAAVGTHHSFEQSLQTVVA